MLGGHVNPPTRCWEDGLAGTVDSGSGGVHRIFTKIGQKLILANEFQKHHLIVSDFDQAPTFNNAGYVLGEILGLGEASLTGKIRKNSKGTQ